MEGKLRLGVFVLLVQVSLAVWQRVTLMEGQTLSLSCPITDADETHVDWKNPEGYIMFFNNKTVLGDKRYSINKLSQSEFSISISDVTFKDGGNYTCSHYGDHTIDRKVEVTVLGYPRMSNAKRGGKNVIKCTAEGTRNPPEISWEVDHGPEFMVHGYVQQNGKKYVSVATLYVSPLKERVTVKCLVRHPALHSHPLMDFVRIGPKRPRPTTTTSSPTVEPTGSARVPGTTSSWFRHGRTAALFTTGGVKRLSPQSSTAPSNQRLSSSDPVTAASGFPLDPAAATGSHLSTRDGSRPSVLPGSTQMSSDAISEATGWTSVSETTEDITAYNGTERNRTESFDSNMQSGSAGGSSLLVFLVTCLIFGLLVVVIFFVIKLRRAHAAWKRENEDSDPSEESSKSKSSHEEKNSQGQRRRGLFNTAFTQYVVQEPAVVTSAVNPAAVTATESGREEPTARPQSPTQSSAKSDIKETSL